MNDLNSPYDERPRYGTYAGIVRMTSSACRPPLCAAKTKTHPRRFPLAFLAAALLLPVAQAAQPGTIVGVVTNSAKLPVAGVTVTALRAGGEAIRATVSGSDGV